MRELNTASTLQSLLIATLYRKGVKECLLPRRHQDGVLFERTHTSNISLSDLALLDALALENAHASKIGSITETPTDKSNLIAIVIPWSIDSLPDSWLMDVTGKGYSTIIGREQRNLVTYTFVPRASSSLQSLFLKSRARAQQWTGVLGLLGKKALLKFFSVNLRTLGPIEFAKDDGYCFRAHAPTLAAWADNNTGSKSPFQLFEDHTPLTNGCSHDDIRQRGKGRFSHWGDCFYFASIDNASPNENFKRYRVFPKSTTWKFLRPLLDVCSELSRHAQRRPIERVGIFAREVLRPSADRFIEELTRLAELRVEARPQDGGTDEIHHLIGTLGVGGAERQLCYLSDALNRQGYEVQVATYPQKEPETMHYLPFLRERGIRHYFASPGHPSFRVQNLTGPRQEKVLSLLSTLPPYLAQEVFDLFTHLSVHKPRVLHCWLDHTNIVGAIAAVLAGVPRIIVSTRNVNPTHFAFCQNWYLEWYKVLATIPGITFVANSNAGAHDYAEWSGIPISRFTIIYNGIDFEAMRSPSEASVRAVRDRLGLLTSNLLVAGIFRFAQEKRPLDFLRVIKRLRKQNPHVRGVLVGSGPMESEVRRMIAEFGLTDSVSLYGTTRDVASVMTAAELILLTSGVEGLPNVLLEAQWFQRPVVCTTAGGSSEVVVDGSTGFVCPIGDIRHISNRCSTLLSDPALRAAFGERGKAHVRSKFTLQQMVEQTRALYGDCGSPARSAGLQAGSVIKEVSVNSSEMEVGSPRSAGLQAGSPIGDRALTAKL